MQSRIFKDKLGLIIRAALSIALIGGLAYHIGSREILTELGLVQWPVLVIVVPVLAAHVMIVTPRWTIILAALGHRIKTSLLVGSVFLGFLFNQLLPTAVGGDVVRALRARQLGVPTEVAIHSVLLDRAAGLFVVLIGAIGLLPFANPVMVRSGLPGLAGFIVAAGLGAGVGLWALGRLERSRIRVIGAVQRAASALNASTGSLVRRPWALIGVLLLSVVGQLIPVVVIGLLAAALSVQLSVVDLTLVSFCATLAAAIPISFAGWGIREGALIFLFGIYGVPPDTAFAISILFGACLAVASAPGALLLFGSHPNANLKPVANSSDR